MPKTQWNTREGTEVGGDINGFALEKNRDRRIFDKFKKGKF